MNLSDEGFSGVLPRSAQGQIEVEVVLQMAQESVASGLFIPNGWRCFRSCGMLDTVAGILTEDRAGMKPDE